MSKRKHNWNKTRPVRGDNPPPPNVASDVPWDLDRSPLWALAHYADPARKGRLVLIEENGNWIRVVEETHETLAELLRVVDPCGIPTDSLEGFCLTKKLSWPAALSVLRYNWKTRAPEERVGINIHPERGRWTFSFWNAFDLGAVNRNDLTFNEPSDETFAAFGLSDNPTIAEVMTEVLLQYEEDIALLKIDNPSLAAELEIEINKWTQHALMTLPAFREHPGRVFQTDRRKLFLCAFELELYGASNVDFIMPEFWDVHGEKAELEVYCAKEAFDRACAGADSPNDD
jgi:hypothetical protein